MGWGEFGNKEDEWGEEVDLEGVGKAGEETEGDSIGDEEGEEREFQGGFPDSAEDEEEGESGEDNADQAGFEEQGEILVLDDFLRGGRFAEIVESLAGAAETDTDEDVFRAGLPDVEGGGVEVDTGVGGAGDVAVEDGGGLDGGGFWRGF